MKRRSLLGIVALGPPMWSWGVCASDRVKPFRIAILDLARANSEAGLRQGLQELGYREGPDVIFHTRYAGGQEDQLPSLAAELVRLKPDLMTSASTQAIEAIQLADKDMFVVMTGNADPIGSGLVSSLARPCGNVTGVTLLSTDGVAKRLALLKEAIPSAKRVGVLAYRGSAASVLFLREIAVTAPALGLEIRPMETAPDEIEAAFAAIVAQKVDVIMVQQLTGLNPVRKRIADLALNHRLPAFHESRTFVEAGGLMSYGANPIELGRRAARYVDRILKGAHPSELPVEQPTKFDLVVNVKTAAALGIPLPISLLARADEIID